MWHLEFLFQIYTHIPFTSRAVRPSVWTNQVTQNRIYNTLLNWLLLTSVPETLFKHSKINNYSLKKLDISISKTLITCIFINIYYLWSLKSVLRALVNIFVLNYVNCWKISLYAFQISQKLPRASLNRRLSL